MFGKISKSVWKFTGSDKSNVYFIEGENKIIIDAGNRTDRDNLKNFMGRAVDFDSVETVIFTHLHYDHCGNFDLFPNAEFYASEQEILDFKKNAKGTVMDAVVAEKLSVVELKVLPKELFDLQVINTPGHTRGSVCLWYSKESVLFSGDTLFGSKRQGRIDLPTSAPDDMKKSIMKIIEFSCKTLAPGHDY